MDNIWNDAGAPGTADGPSPGQAWQTWATNFFDNVGRSLNSLLQSGNTQFMDDSMFDQTYEHDELR